MLSYLPVSGLGPAFIFYPKNHMPIRRSLTLLFLFLCSLELHAQDLYSGEVLVTAQNAGERAQAVPSALIQVLQKLSGQRELPVSPALDSALLSANRIMVSFHYRNRERIAPDGSVSEEWWLVARFLPAAVDRIVSDLQLPRWRKERQAITIWVVVDDGLGRRLMPVEYGYAWEAMTDLAAMRGLPVAWPELDEGPADEQGAALGELPGGEQEQEQVPDTGQNLEEDRGGAPGKQVDLQLLWGGFTEQLLDRESGSGGVAIVAARREGAEWNIRWNYANGEETAGWRNRDRDLSFALAAGVHYLTDLVASRNSIALAGQGQWQYAMNVGGISGARDYERCLGYLQGLSLVNKVEIEEVSPGSVSFVLDINALPEYLVETITRDQVLEPGSTASDYRLLP